MTSKTLEELNVQVGDIVRSTDTGYSYTGYSYVVRVVDMKPNETHTMPDGSVAWRVEVKPVVRQNVRFNNIVDNWITHSSNSTHKLTYDTIDGEIDCASVKMVKL